MITELGLCFLIFSNTFAKTGKGELKLSKYTMENLMMYMYGRANPKWSDGVDKKNKPMLMTVSADGKSSHYYYCPYTECQTGNYVYKSIKACEKSSNGSPCYLFATKRRIKWKNSINTKHTNISSKLLKEPYEIAKIIQNLGFYDGDITELPGIDYKTGALDDSKKITGQIDNFDYPILIASLSASHKSDWREYVNFKRPHKVWFMAKRKDNGMTYSWETGTSSLSYTEGKGFDRCNNWVKEEPNRYPKDTICILYYKGTSPTTDKEKIETAKKYYSQIEVDKFFNKFSYILNDKNNPLLNKSKITKKSNSQSDDIVLKLKELKELLDSGVLTKEEFEKAKKKVLN